MENLIDLIRKEFTLARYESVWKEDDRLLKHQDYNDYWYIYPMDGELDINTLQERIYSDLVAFRRDNPESDKSTSLLILQQVNNSDKNRQQVIDAENNVYYFKKYVIQYSEKDWEATSHIIPTDYKSLGHELMKPDVFEHVKKEENSPFLFLYTLAHKLPFVMMNAEKRDYNCRPSFQMGAGLDHIFAWTERIKDIEGKNASDEEITMAKDAIDRLINAEENE